MRIAVWVLGVAAVCAQTAPPLNDTDALKLGVRAQELMEAASLGIPELARAGTPLAENARQSMEVLRTASGQPPAPWHRFLLNLRAFLLLSDSVPKPASLAPQTLAQLSELRECQARLESYFLNLLERLQQLVLSSDRDNTARYREANARQAPVEAVRPRVVFMGDSITDGWRLNEYFPDRDFVNRGISGQITGQMLGRFRADVIELKPAAVVILAGTNDIARGVALPAIEANLGAMADLADHYQIKVILASVLPFSDYHAAVDPRFERTRQRPPDVIRALNDWIREFCRMRNYVYLNYWPATADDLGMLRTELSKDGLHPDAPGYRLMATLVLEAIEKSLPPVKPPARRRRP